MLVPISKVNQALLTVSQAWDATITKPVFEKSGKAYVEIEIPITEDIKSLRARCIASNKINPFIVLAVHDLVKDWHYDLGIRWIYNLTTREISIAGGKE